MKDVWKDHLSLNQNSFNSAQQKSNKVSQVESIAAYLSKTDEKYTYRPKQLISLNQCLTIQETQNAILELFEKEVEFQKLSTTDQYILHGYIYIYIPHMMKSNYDRANRFDLERRVKSQNRVDSLTAITQKQGQNVSNLIKEGPLRKELRIVEDGWRMLEMQRILCPVVFKNKKEQTYKIQFNNMLKAILKIQKNDNEIQEVNKILKKFKEIIVKMSKQ